MRWKILVVDDEEDIRRFLGTVLKEKGYEVLLAAEGEEALALAGRERPHLVLLDIMMPAMDGWEVLRRLKADAHTARIPVAVVSARTEVRARALSEGAGVADFVEKPFSLHDLLRRIEGLLRGTEPQSARPRDP
jgi:DNA-binding response OmpR family regulator